MSEALGLLSRVGADAVSALISSVNGDPLPPAIVFVGFAFTLAALIAMTVAVRATSARPSQGTTAGHRTPQRNADLRVLISQSNPDAPGHIRARALDDARVAHLIPAGDETESERMLAAARRALLTSSPEDFAREWGIPSANVQ
ncbi:MAG: hypothetical protein JWQ64_322 [Subtercola sp.]|jgi:hypothetical protein|nr:hypothetical protein [Subtercola sp.]